MSRVSQDLLKPLAWSYDGHLLKQTPFAAVIAAVGLLVLLLPGDRAPDRDAALAGGILIAAGLGFIAFALYVKAHPREPQFRISPQGVRYRLPAGKDVLIPWREVRSVDSIDLWMPRHRPWRFRLRDVTVLAVSKRFFDSTFGAGFASWHGSSTPHKVIRKGDQVQIVFLHDLLTMPARDVREALEARWRAFSDRPEAKLPRTPAKARAPDMLERLAPSAGLKRAALVALALAALPVVYFSNWGWARLSFSVPQTAGSAYVGELLDKGGLPARHQDGRMGFVLRAHVAGDAAPECVREIVRDGASRALLPEYTASATCRVPLTLTSGEPAVGVFRLVVADASWEDFSGKIHPGRAIVTAPLTLDEADRRLCALGVCKEGGPPLAGR